MKYDDGHLVRWQKPKALIQRILDPFTDKNDLVLDLFMGTGVVGKWALENDRSYIGIENDNVIFNLAKLGILYTVVNLDIPEML